MVKPIKLPSYSALAKHLAEYAIIPAEVHGVICGLVCIIVPCTIETIRPFLFKTNETLSEKLQNQIQQIIDYTTAKVTVFDFDFQLLLPSDDEPLDIRTEALSAWCQGFAIVLKRNGINPEELSLDSQDALKHIMAIAKLDHEALDIREEDENAYAEIVEYMRMVVLMVYGDIHNTKTGRTPSKRLH